MSVSVFGSLNLDIALRLPARAAWGQTLLVPPSEQAVGGKGLNQAIACARFGSKTRMAGAVGGDPTGARLLDALAADGVDTTQVEVLASEASGRATILIEPDGDNIIAVEPGANMAAQANKAQGALNARSRVLLMQLENDIEQIAALLASGAAAPVRKILNAAPAIPEGAKLFGMLDMLIFNQTEFAQYLQLDREPEALDDLLVARRLLTREDQVVVVTLGATGAAAVWPERTVFVPAVPAEAVVDTSGAGDCFCGVIAACIDQGIDLDHALHLANAAASLSVGTRGAAPSMPMRAQVDARLQACA